MKIKIVCQEAVKYAVLSVIQPVGLEVQFMLGVETSKGIMSSSRPLIPAGRDQGRARDVFPCATTGKLKNVTQYLCDTGKEDAV